MTRRADGSRRLYDLAKDPHEENDLAPLRGEVVSSLASDLSSLLAAARKAPHQPAEIEPDADTRARLEALGYVDEHRDAAGQE